MHPVDVTETEKTSHVASSQHPVNAVDDPALDKSHQHHHDHVHHSANAEKGRTEELLYSQGTTMEKSTIPQQNPQDRDLYGIKLADSVKSPTVLPEIGDLRPEEDPQTHTFSNFYKRHRVIFHLLLWLLFTGLVPFPRGLSS